MGEFSVPRKLAPPPQLSSISFSGGGWLQFYLYGVAKAMQSCGIVDLTHVKVCGCSAGALAAAGLVYDGDFDGAVDFAKYECIPRAHSEISGLFKLGLYVGECVELHMLPKYRKLASRLEIAITKLPSLQAVRVSNFDTVDDFKSCLLASCAAFPLAPLVYRKGSWWVDGGFTDFQPIVNENTLTVSPFYFSTCDIKPSRYVPLWWAVIPPKSIGAVDWLYDLGYQDGLAFFEKLGIYNDGKRPHLKLVSVNAHAYQTPRMVTLDRLLGYNLSALLNKYVMYLLDLWLFVVLICICKPFMLWIIYTELLVVMVIRVWIGLLLSILSPFSIFSSVGLSPMAKIREYWKGFTMFFSLSLWKRILSHKVTPEEIAEHDALEKVSLFYRVFKHGI